MILLAIELELNSFLPRKTAMFLPWKTPRVLVVFYLFILNCILSDKNKTGQIYQKQGWEDQINNLLKQNKSFHYIVIKSSA